MLLLTNFVCIPSSLVGKKIYNFWVQSKGNVRGSRNGEAEGRRVIYEEVSKQSPAPVTL